MSIQIENSGSTIKITDNGVSFNIPKPFYIRYTQDILQPGDVVDDGRIIIQYYTGTESQEWNCVWTNITVPVAATVSLMKDAIEALEDNGIGQEVTIVGPIGQKADASSVSVVLSSGVQTLNSVVTVASGTLAAGKKSVKFTTSNNFVGTINGVSREANRAISASADAGKTLDSIPYTISSGNITIDTIV